MIFVDTSALCALADRGDPRHARVVRLVDQVSFLVMKKRGARRAFAFDRDFVRRGFVLLE